MIYSCLEGNQEAFGMGKERGGDCMELAQTRALSPPIILSDKLQGVKIALSSRARKASRGERKWYLLETITLFYKADHAPRINPPTPLARKAGSIIIEPSESTTFPARLRPFPGHANFNLSPSLRTRLLHHAVDSHYVSQ